MSGRTEAQWVKAIGDCGVLRVAFDDDALLSAYEKGLVQCEIVEGNDDALDFRLTRIGAAMEPRFRAAGL